MSRTVVILDDTPASQLLGLAMLQSIGTIVSSVQFVTVDDLPLIPAIDTIYCPLTLQVPASFSFWGQLIGQVCQEINSLRHLAAATTGVKVGDGGELWLPVIWTAGEPIYGEVIGEIEPTSDLQLLARFGSQLLAQITAPPATYLVQFSYAQEQVVFDRLFPFPAAPALASIGIQQPDLFASHWRCISEKGKIIKFR
jgi:hypothetical protein